jgi:hypothetical protein
MHHSGAIRRNVSQWKGAAGLCTTAVDLWFRSLQARCCKAVATEPNSGKSSIGQAFDFPGGPDRTRTCRFRKPGSKLELPHAYPPASTVCSIPWRSLSKPGGPGSHRLRKHRRLRNRAKPRYRTDCRSLAQADSELRLGRPRPICIRRQPVAAPPRAYCPPVCTSVYWTCIGQQNQFLS